VDTDAALRGILLQMESERSHDWALRLLGWAQKAGSLGLNTLRSQYAADLQPSPVTVAGLTFPNRVGLAAGYDKNALAWQAFAALGFGHVEVGTVTPQPQPGNPQPRVFRLEDRHAVINRLGFPSEGAAVVRRRLSMARPYDMVLGVNLGRNKATPNERAADDYVSLVGTFADVADYFTVNVSSPNTPELRALQSGEALRTLLSAVKEARDAAQAEAHGPQPVFVKLAPDLDDADLDDALGAVLQTGIDGVIATNTTIGREGVQGHANAGEAGGLSGAPLTDRSREMVQRIRARVPADLPLISVGGIMDPDEARRRRDLGADLVQLYTGVIYAGPGLASAVARAIS